MAQLRVSYMMMMMMAMMMMTFVSHLHAYIAVIICLRTKKVIKNLRSEIREVTE